MTIFGRSYHLQQFPPLRNTTLDNYYMTVATYLIINVPTEAEPSRITLAQIDRHDTDTTGLFQQSSSVRPTLMGYPVFALHLVACASNLTHCKIVRRSLIGALHLVHQERRDPLSSSIEIAKPPKAELPSCARAERSGGLVVTSADTSSEPCEKASNLRSTTS